MSSLGKPEYGAKAHILPKGWRPAFGQDSNALCGVTCYERSKDPRRKLCLTCKAIAEKMEPK